MYVFNAATNGYVGAATMGPGAAYSISLPAGSYKLYTQTNAPAYPDQWYAGTPDIGAAAVVPLAADTVQDITLAAPATFTLSGNVTTPGGPLGGTFVYVFNATTNGYVGAATMGPGAAYSISLPAGSYKLYTQTNTPAYPDQWYAGTPDIGAAAVVPLAADTVQDITLAAPATFTLSGNVTTPGGPLGGTFVYVFNATTNGYVGAATMGPGAAYSISLPAGSYKLYTQTNTPAYPDQWYAGTPTSGPRPSSRWPPTPSRTSPSRRRATFTLSGNVTTPGGLLGGTFVYVFNAATNGYVGAATMGPGAAYSISLPAGSYKLYTQTNTPAYPDQWYAGTPDIGAAAVVPLAADTVQDITLAAPATFTLSGNVTTPGGPLGGTFVYVFNAATNGYVGAATMGPGAAYSISLPGRGLQALHPDQHPRLPRPVVRRHTRHRGRGRRPAGRRHRPGPHPRGAVI